MSRSGYSDDYDFNLLNLYRGTVHRAINGKRGQVFLKNMLKTLDQMPVKKLAAEVWIEQENACALGVVMQAAGHADKLEGLDPTDDYGAEIASKMLDIAPSLARELVFINDDGNYMKIEPETDENRWTRVRHWVQENIKTA